MSVDDELRALIVSKELGLLSEAEEQRVAEALAKNPALERLSADAVAALADPEPGPLTAPEGAWEGIANRINEVRAQQLVGEKLSIALRCTFCHDHLERAEAAYCAACLAPHHGGCFREHGQCSAMGCGETQVVSPQAPSAPVVRQGWRQRAVVAAAAGLGFAAAAALGWSLSGGPVAADPAGDLPNQVDTQSVQQGDSGPQRDPQELLREARELLRSARDHVVLAKGGGEEEAREQAERDVDESLATVETAEGRLMRGLIRLQANEVELARADLERALTLEPDLVPAREGLGLIALQQREFEAACGHYQAALAIQRSVAAELGLARALEELGRRDEAVAQLARVIERDPTNATALLLKAELALKDERPADAERWFSRAIEVQPKLVEAYVGRASSRVLGGQYEAATADLNRAVTLDPFRADAWVQLATLQHAMRRSDDALRAAKYAVELGPSSQVSARQLATVLRGLDRHELAAEVDANLDSLPALPPDRGPVATILKRIELNAGGGCALCDKPVPGVHRLELEGGASLDFCTRAHLLAYLDGERKPEGSGNAEPKRGEEELRRAMAVRKQLREEAAVLRERAKAALSAAGRSKDADLSLRDALADVDRALALTPAALELVLLRAKVQIALGDTAGAQASLGRIDKAPPEQLTEDIYAWSKHLRGRIELDAGRIDEALRLLDQAASTPGLKTENAELFLYVGVARHRNPKRSLDDLHVALFEIRRAVQLNPELTEGAFYLGAVKADIAVVDGDAKLWGEVLKHMKRTEELRKRMGGGFPPDYALDLLRGLANAALTRPQQATEYLERYLQTAPKDDPNLERAKQALQKLTGVPE